MKKVKNLLLGLWKDEDGNPTAEHVLWLILGVFSCGAIVMGLVGGYRGKVGDAVWDVQRMETISDEVDHETGYGYQNTPGAEKGETGIILKPEGTDVVRN